jgi:hypothetical protein
MPDDGFRSMETTRLFSQDVDDEPEKKPSTSEMILGLAVPALGALLIDPLLTLADTAFVGRFSETAALAGKLFEFLWVCMLHVCARCKCYLFIMEVHISFFVIIKGWDLQQHY